MATDPPLTDREIRMANLIADADAKRAHMHRMLVDQRFLLADALDAIRAGDNHVAEEFVGRFLTHVDAEIKHQRGA